MLTTGATIAFHPTPENRVTGQVLVLAGDWLLVRLDTPPHQVGPYPHPFVVAADEVEVIEGEAA